MSKKINMLESLTLDNDTAFAASKNMGACLKSDIFFCDPYKSYQKGAIENGNRLIRENFPREQELIKYLKIQLRNRWMS